MKFRPNNQENVLAHIRTLGKFSDNFQINDPFTVEDYICPNDDHDFMHKDLNGNRESDESMVVDFSSNKPLTMNINFINDRITLKESSELIEKPTLFQFDEFPAAPESDSSVFDENTMNLVNKNESKMEIHNCNGTIDLKKKSKLTINTNCRGGDRDNDLSFSSMSTDTSSSIAAVDVNCATYNCEFYNRLINEIKNSIKRSDHGHIPSSTKDSSIRNNGARSSTTDANSRDSYCKKVLLKNMKNLPIQIPDDGVEQSKLSGCLIASTITRPVQIETWLKEIVSETEIEPMLNLEILEHRIINTSTSP